MSVYSAFFEHIELKVEFIVATPLITFLLPILLLSNAANITPDSFSVD